MASGYLPGKPGSDDDRRRVGRDEGLNLLFAAAQDVAREEGKLADGTYASLEQSRISPTSFTLISATGHTIARVSLIKAREVIAVRREIAREITRQAKLEITPYANDQGNKKNFRNLPEETRALCWAISTGRRFPTKGYTRRDVWIGLLLLIPGILPGVLVLGRIAQKRKRYETSLKELVRRWRSNGRQDPAPNLFAHFHLDS
jgi:hypothetical protein